MRLWGTLPKKLYPACLSGAYKPPNFAASSKKIMLMKVITIDSEAYKTLVRKIDRVYNYIKQQSEKEAAPPPDTSQIWIGNEEAAEVLEISQRTLQRLRSNGDITYSIRGGKVRYTLREIQRLITGRVVVSKYRQEGDLLRAHQQYQERRKGMVNKEKK